MKKTAKQIEVKSAKKFGKRPFPKVTLEEALGVPLKIKELNGGHPWDPASLAKAFNLSATTMSFYYLTAAARDYGLTVGTRDTSKIELAPLGRDIAYAPNAEVERQLKLSAFQNIDVFKRVFEYYKGSVLPEMKYLGNTLEKEFGLPPDTHEEFSKLFRENCSYLNLKSGRTSTSNNLDNTIPKTVVLGEPKGDVGPKLFVIMPFTEKTDLHAKGFFDEVLRSLITPAGVQASFHVETANRQGSDVIQSTIINELLAADLVLADLTEHNPNVLFELGVRMAHSKPIVLIKASGTGKIFDIDNMLRVYEYDSNLWNSTVESDLPKIKEHIESAWKNRESKQTYMNILMRGSVVEEPTRTTAPATPKREQQPRSNLAEH